MGDAIDGMHDTKLMARELNRERVRKFVQSFEPARMLANGNGMMLTNPSQDGYLLRHSESGWIYNLYPKVSGHAPRVWVNPKHPSPFLKLPYQWDLLDVVNAVLRELKPEQERSSAEESSQSKDVGGPASGRPADSVRGSGGSCEVESTSGTADCIAVDAACGSGTESDGGSESGN